MRSKYDEGRENFLIAVRSLPNKCDYHAAHPFWTRVEVSIELGIAVTVLCTAN